MAFKVGDKVIYHSGWGGSETITEVIRVTPTGRIRVRKNTSLQFDKHGNIMGHSDSYYIPWISECTEEDIKRVCEKQTIEKCESLMRNRHPTYEQAVKIIEILEKKEEDK